MHKGAQIAVSAECDFELGTWTFKITEGVRVGAGRYALIPMPNVELGPNVENEMDDPNMHAYGEDGPGDAEIGRQWRENSSLEKWFPLTAERLAAKERENLHLAREARTWWEACRDATGEAERLRGETDVLRAWIKAALVPLQSIADLEDFEDGGDGMNALIDAGRKFLGPNDEAHRKDAAGGLSGGADCSAAT